MAAKRKVTIKRKPKEVKEEVIEKEVTLEEAIEEIEKPVTTVVEEEISVEEVVEPKKSRRKGEIVGNGTRTTYVPPKGRIRFEAQVAPVPMFMLPKHIQTYLLSKGLGTNVWKKDKEWLTKHKVDMKIVEELKQFLSSRS